MWLSLLGAQPVMAVCLGLFGPGPWLRAAQGIWRSQWGAPSCGDPHFPGRGVSLCVARVGRVGHREHHEGLAAGSTALCALWDKELMGDFHPAACLHSHP